MLVIVVTVVLIHDISVNFVCFNGLFRSTWVSWYQSISILDFIGAKDDGDGDSWS